MLKVWAAFSVVLIVLSLVLGVLLFAATGSKPTPLASEVAKAVDEGVRLREKVSKELNKPVQVEISEDVTYDANAAIVLVASRIGSVVILLFLVSVLVNLYRDNIKQAAFYDRWADAFQLAGTDHEVLKRYIELFFLERLDFDKAPRSPLDNVAVALRGLNSKIAEKVMGKNGKE